MKKMTKKDAKIILEKLNRHTGQIRPVSENLLSMLKPMIGTELTEYTFVDIGVSMPFFYMIREDDLGYTVYEINILSKELHFAEYSKDELLINK